jgi:hypothetical protein
MNRLASLKTFKKSLLGLLAVILLLGLLCLYHPFRREVRIVTQTTIAHLYASPTVPFPAIPTASLTPVQQRIVVLSRREYAKKPVSYDATVLAYTQGVSEPWCADFASWIFKQVGQPFNNPNSGSWRIPGVYTLQAYFQTRHDYRIAGTYVPKTGDVAIYHTGEGHTNIVLSVHGNEMTTIGGNETGHLRIETQSYAKGVDGLDGFGVLASEKFAH